MDSRELRDEVRRYKLDETMDIARRHGNWEGDVRGDVYISGLPFDDLGDWVGTPRNPS